MITLWDKNGNKCVSLSFDKFNLSNLWKYECTNSTKGIDSFIEKNFWLLGFKFTYIDVNYDNIVFVKISPEDNYTKYDDSHKISILKETLNNWIDSNTYNLQHPLFNWNYEVRNDNTKVFYLTGEKKWFENNGLNSLITPFREITFNSSDFYFPKYNPKTTNIVKCFYSNVLV